MLLLLLCLLLIVLANANANDLQHIILRFAVLVLNCIYIELYSCETSLMSSKPVYGLCQYTCQVVAIIRPSAPIDPSLTLVGGGDH